MEVLVPDAIKELPSSKNIPAGMASILSSDDGGGFCMFQKTEVQSPSASEAFSVQAAGLLQRCGTEPRELSPV